MENQEFQKHIITRLQKLEEKTFEGTYEQNYSPREQAERITDEKTKEHHIGKKSPLVLKQELDSHIQGYRETFSKKEKSQWHEKKNNLLEQLRKATS